MILKLGFRVLGSVGRRRGQTGASARCVFPLRFREDDSVDDVDHTVVRDEVGFYDFSVVDRYSRVGDFRCPTPAPLLAINSFSRSSGKRATRPIE